MQPRLSSWHSSRVAQPPGNTPAWADNRAFRDYGQLPADGRSASLQHVGYLAWFMSRLLQGVNLVLFFPGEVCVVDFCNFDWLVKKAWMLPHPAHLTRVTQNYTSFLNSP
ncbi:MAG: hypothetical protein ABI475_03805 [Methylophilaceae bacterium]